MVTAGQGWEMAFYWSPLVFLTIDAVIILGCIAALVGVAVGPDPLRRVQAALAGSVCIGCFLALAWQ
jgi:hypothetical protein